MNGMVGGLNFYGCGEGCLKCDSQLGGSQMKYIGTTANLGQTVVYETQKRQCHACDW